LYIMLAIIDALACVLQRAWVIRSQTLNINTI
jgi:hypothetical protein